MVLALTGFGIEQPAIAAELGINVRTLSKHYKNEILVGTPRLIAKLAASLTRRALDPKGGMPSTVANIFMLKTRGRWRESQLIQHEGRDGEALQNNGTVNFVTVSLPDNGTAPPMKTIEGRALKTIAHIKAKAAP
jgi:hypothetical protein